MARADYGGDPFHQGPGTPKAGPRGDGSPLPRLDVEQCGLFFGLSFCTRLDGSLGSGRGRGASRPSEGGRRGVHAEGGLGPPTSTPESGKTPLRDCRERWPHHSLGPSPSLRLAELPHERGGIASPPFLGFRARRGLPRAAGCSFGACRRKSLRSRGDPSKRSAALSALRSSKCRSPACAAAAAVSGRAALASVASLALGRSPVRGSGFSWSSPWPGVCLQGGC